MCSGRTERPATLGPGFEGVEKLLGLDASRLSAQQRDAFASMTPEQKAALEKVIAFAPLAKKAAFVAFCIIAAMMVVPFVIALFVNS